MASPPNQNRGPGAQDGLRGELKGDASRLGEAARTQAEAEARQQKENVARSAHSASAAIDLAAQELRQDDDAPQWLASAFSGAARQLDGLAGRLQGRTPREVVADLDRFARQRPMAFLAASAAIGFAVARFARAGLDHQAEHEDDESLPHDRGGEAPGREPVVPAASPGRGASQQVHRSQPGGMP